MTLLLLILLLAGPFLLKALIARSLVEFEDPGWAWRLGISLVFLLTGSAHFSSGSAMSMMLPSFIPLRLEIVYLTGILELLGSMGVWVKQLRKTVGWSLIVFLIGVLPSNFYAAFSYIDFGGHSAGPSYLFFRVPFQFLLIWWIHRGLIAERPDHLRSRSVVGSGSAKI